MDYNTKLCGCELFENIGHKQISVLDFWQWSMSRLIADGPRGDLAEFIVRIALGADIKTPKTGWGEYDIEYNGSRIEVKCSSLLQAWRRDKDSKPIFSISPTTNCKIKQDENGEWYYHGPDGTPPRRRSDAYVFCLFANTNRDSANVLNMEQWVFFVIDTDVIDKELGEKRSISVKTIEKLGAKKTPYGELKKTIDNCLHVKV